MPTIAIVFGVRIIVLEGSLPRAKLRAVQKWLAEHREQVAYVWREIRELRYQGGMIDE